MTPHHERGESVFKAMRAEDIVWKPFAAFPAGAQLAVLVGDPAEPGPYAVRVKVPGGVKLMPHRHPEDRIYTVMSRASSTSASASASMSDRCRHFRPAVSSSFPATWRTSTSRSPAST